MKIVAKELKNAHRAKNIFLPLSHKEPLKKVDVFSFLPPSIKTTLEHFIKKEFSGDEGQIKAAWFPRGVIERAIMIGLGEKTKWNSRKSFVIPRLMTRWARREKLSELSSPLIRTGGESPRTAAKNFSVGAIMANYEFTRYKEKPKQGLPNIKSVTLFSKKDELKEVVAGITEGIAIGEETNQCRDLANTPGGDMTPAVLANEAERVAKKYGFGATIFNETKMKELGMGGVLGVAQGSDKRPRFIILEYRGGAKNEKPLVVVGKGVTFDTGGLSLKPDPHMYEMHMDMSGGAAVIHGIAAIARLKIPVTVVGIIPAVENMPSGTSYRPGDLLKSMSGKVIEVLNTDAEGRVILSDALWYGATVYKPGLMVDIATLTGAAHVALGNYMSAIFTNRDSLQEKLISVGVASGDYVWPMPLWDEYLPEIKGTFGDFANVSAKDRWGGAIHGAKFLEQFVNNVSWAHLDIAPRMTTVESDQLSRGASGVGVRYIVELAKQYQNFIQ